MTARAFEGEAAMMMANMGHDLYDLPRLFEDDALDCVATFKEVRADPEESRLQLLLRVRSLSGSEVQRIVDCHNAIRWELNEDTIYRFDVLDEHPALLPFLDEQGDLYFSSAPRDPERTSDRLRAAAAQLLGRFFDFDAAVNTAYGALPALLAAGDGKVAEGPMTLMRIFQDVLEADGAKANVLPAGPRKIYIERKMQWVPGPRQLSVLDLGSSWVVAQRFQCRAG